MKVLLKEDVENLGYAGEVHLVADGYGRNYLVPRGKAVMATPKILKTARIWRDRAEARRAQLRAEYALLAEKVSAVTLTFTAKAGEKGKLYGSITSAQVTDELNAKLGTSFDRRLIVTEPLRQLGEHEVTVRLSGDFHPVVKVIIEPEGGAAIAAPVVPVGAAQEAAYQNEFDDADDEEDEA